MLTALHGESRGHADHRGLPKHAAGTLECADRDETGARSIRIRVSRPANPYVLSSGSNASGRDPTSTCQRRISVAPFQLARDLDRITDSPASDRGPSLRLTVPCPADGPIRPVGELQLEPDPAAGDISVILPEFPQLTRTSPSACQRALPTAVGRRGVPSSEEGVDEIARTRCALLGWNWSRNRRTLPGMHGAALTERRPAVVQHAPGRHLVSAWRRALPPNRPRVAIHQANSSCLPPRVQRTRPVMLLMP